MRRKEKIIIIYVCELFYNEGRDVRLPKDDGSATKELWSIINELSEVISPKISGIA